MRTYFIKIPTWARQVYPKATWDQQGQHPLLTFDDGPHPSSTPQLLRLLDDLNQKAVFFLLGENAAKYPSLVQDIRAAGHTIGNHGFTHLDGWRIKSTDFICNVEKGQELLETNLFRPPFGRMTSAQYRWAVQNNEVMMWSLMPGDFDPQVSIQLLTDRLVNVQKHDIIVLHDDPSSIDKYKNVNWDKIIGSFIMSSITL